MLIFLASWRLASFKKTLRFWKWTILLLLIIIYTIVNHLILVLIRYDFIDTIMFAFVVSLKLCFWKLLHKAIAQARWRLQVASWRDHIACDGSHVTIAHLRNFVTFLIDHLSVQIGAMLRLDLHFEFIDHELITVADENYWAVVVQHLRFKRKVKVVGHDQP